ncbi:nucleotidyltransferase family protein, partial [Staphylococcus aureus]
MRSFTDIDILIPVSVREEASRVLAANGFVLHSREYRGDRDFFEDVWLLEEDKRVSLEVHSNLV